VKGVEQLLAELREHGTIDSQGEFTLSLSEARRKLVQYHSSDKARYLLLLLAAGIAAGAGSALWRLSGRVATSVLKSLCTVTWLTLLNQTSAVLAMYCEKQLS
jgi:hypothetical protein